MVSAVPSTSEVLTFPGAIMTGPRCRQQYWARRGGETGMMGERSTAPGRGHGPGEGRMCEALRLRRRGPRWEVGNRVKWRAEKRAVRGAKGGRKAVLDSLYRFMVPGTLAGRCD